MTRNRNSPRRGVAARLRRLGAGERLLAIVMAAALAGGLALISEGVWLKVTADDPAKTIVHAAEHSGRAHLSDPVLR
jgi:hypothetical protein